MKRRDFVTRSIAAGAAAWLMPGVSEAAHAIGAGAGAAAAAPSTAAPMTRAWFEQRVGRRVLLEKDGAEPIAATIKAVRERAARTRHPRAAETDQFSVVFALKTTSPVDGLCRMRTGSDGAHAIFVSRGGDRARTVHAHFNLLT